MPSRVVDLYTCWWTFGSPTKCCCVKKKKKKLMPTCLLWCLWRERNNISFEDWKRTFEEIKFIFFKILYLWTAAYVSPLTIS
jgi:hypothetical protein